MNDREIRLRCVEAATKSPIPHPGGYVVGALEAAARYEQFVVGGAPAPADAESYWQDMAAERRPVLGVPGKR